MSSSKKKSDEQASHVWMAESSGILPSRDLLGPLALITIMPPLMVYLPRILHDHQGSIWTLIAHMKSEGFVNSIYNNWYTWKDPMAIKIVFAILGLEMLLVRVVPGPKMTGPVSMAGIRYEYNGNGLACYIITMVLYWLGAYLGFYNGGILVDKLGEIISFNNVMALTFCGFLYVKGLYFPSSADHGSTGSIVFDYFWGTELNPRIFGWDVKQITNVRFGMIFWGLFCLSAIMKQMESFGYVSDSMWVSAGLQMLYVTKFYIWEDGYYASYDIIHDYAGFYLCWGCTVYIPGVYCANMYWIAHNPVNMGWSIAGSMIALGIIITWAQWDADVQPRLFRELNGKMQIWGKPAKYVMATYKTSDGKEKTNMLLASGYYGDLSVRHIRYTFEITLAALWCIPCFTTCLMPNVYLPYMIILLIDRMYRIEVRCHNKYGKYWDEYRKRVPYYMIPYLY